VQIEGLDGVLSFSRMLFLADSYASATYSITERINAWSATHHIPERQHKRLNVIRVFPTVVYRQRSYRGFYDVLRGCRGRGFSMAKYAKVYANSLGG
jgi:hypothetical protein